jgi:hypothetical protein
MDRNTVLTLFADATEFARTAFESIPKDAFGLQPEGWFGPGEIIVHLMQSEGFAHGFIQSELRSESIDMHNSLKEVLKAGAPNSQHARLSIINLKGARAQCAAMSKTMSASDIIQKWVDARAKIFGTLVEIEAPTMKHTTLDHPLVGLPRRELVWVCYHLFVAHSTYYVGELNMLMKTLGKSATVPFMFGTFRATA